MTVKQAQCSSSPGKRRYDEEWFAIAAVLRAARRTAMPLRVYRCEDCRGWHLTKRPVWIPSYVRRRTLPHRSRGVWSGSSWSQLRVDRCEEVLGIGANL